MRWIPTFILAACLPACGSEQPVSTYIFYGTAICTSWSASARNVYIRLTSPDGDIESPAAYQAGCQLEGPSCDFQHNSVAEGEYRAFGFIDMNANAAYGDPLPDTGDLVSPGRPLYMLAKQRMDFPDASWHLMP
ncbi:MAG: hypothetical protein JXR96_27400 [Deltaproteobacteria bacterium]|nr:hypothetical protein [Deltaproteobacteria bacterium]